MSEDFDFNPQDDTSIVGSTSQDVVQDALDEAEEKKKKGWEIFNLWNCLLMVSLLFVSLATVQLVFVLRSYVPDWPFGSSPWSTGL